MKKILTAVLLCIVLIGVNAQILDENADPKRDNNEIKTIFSGDKSYGGYFDVYINYSQANSRDALEIGSRLAFIIGHSFAIGVDGAGFITNIEKDDLDNENLLTGGYGGLLLEPIIFPKTPVHITFPVVLGGGAAVYAVTDPDYQDEMIVDNVDPFLVLKPGIEIEFNVTKFLRFSLMASYKITTEIGTAEERYIDAGGMNAFSSGISFKFGKF